MIRGGGGGRQSGFEKAETPATMMNSGIPHQVLNTVPRAHCDAWLLDVAPAPSTRDCHSGVYSTRKAILSWTCSCFPLVSLKRALDSM